MNIKRLAFLFCLASFFSCDSDDLTEETVEVAVPITISKLELRSSVAIESPKPISEAGKIYAYKDYIFINDDFTGIHIIDNSDPSSPRPMSFIKIPGNADISVKDDFLYADSATDLLVFDLTDFSRVKMVQRLEDVFSYYDYNIPVEAEFVEWQNIDYNNDIILGWSIEQRPKADYENRNLEFFDLANTASESVGQGGSLARFQIVDDYLYTVGSDNMSIFDISSLSEANLVNTQYAGWRIETMFHADEHLYLGGTNGMYIYSLEDPSAPSYVSEFNHWEGCDPVVVDGDYAYLTLRGGNACGQIESVLEVIDIKDKANPILAERYVLDNPYGLGFKNDILFVCDGESGLKLFDKSDPTQLNFIRDFKDVFARDVIPLDDVLLMLADNSINQYRYTDGNLELLSSFSLN